MKNHIARFKFGMLPLAIVFLMMTVVNMPAYADTFQFYLGPEPSNAPISNGVFVGPYPGTLQDQDSGLNNPNSMFMCLDADIGTSWNSWVNSGPPGGYAYNFTNNLDPNSIPNTVAHEEESAFLASLLLYDETRPGVVLDQTFYDNYNAPISFAIWQIMGTLDGNPTPYQPSGSTTFVNETEAFVAEAQEIYTYVLTNSSNPAVAAFLSQFQVFVPNPLNSNQRFLTVVSDNAFIASIPEPGTVGLFAIGLVLVGFSRKRFTGRR